MKTKQNKTNPGRILGYLMAFAMVFFSFGTSNAQCSGYTSPYGYYGSYDMGTLTNGVETQISSCSYAGEIFSLTNLTAGDEILITTCGNGFWDSFLEVRDLSGNCIAANDDGFGCDYNYAAQVTFTVPASGDYDLVINDYGGGASMGCRIIMATNITVLPTAGCMDPTAANYNSAATVDDGTCTYGIPGCTDVAACNFDANATANDGSCTYAAVGYDCAGNCLNGGTTYTISVTGGLYPSEVSWTVTNSAGTVVLSGGAPYSSTLCVTADCYTLNMFDSFGDGWNGAVLSLSTGGLTVGTATIATGSTGTANFGIGVTCPVYGCTDPTATNYNAGANTDDGSCAYTCTAAPYCENFNLGVGTWTNNGWINDASGTPSSFTGPTDDITGGSFYMFYETSGTPQSPITLTSECFDISGLTAPTLSFYNHMYGATTGSLNVYVNGTLEWTMSGDQGPQWNWEQVNLSAYAGTNVTIMFEATYGGGFTGDIAIDQVCLDEFFVINGCTDPVALNYDATANTDDGSCTYCPGTMLSLDMGDTFGDGWNGAEITFTGNNTGTVFGPYTIASGNSVNVMMCMPTDCYAINVTAGSWPDEVFWTVTDPVTGAVLASFGNSTYPANGAPYSNQGGLSVGVTCPVYGCTDATALNYDSLASADDGSCAYLCDVYVATAAPITVPSCNGAFDASATAFIAGSFGNDFWLWDNGSTSSTITGVGAGTYSCTITDSVNLCTSTVSVTIAETPVISIVGATVDATPGNANGIINLTLSGGTPCYNGAAMSLAGASSTSTQWVSNAFDVVAASDLQITAISQPSMAGFGSANVWYRLGSGLGHEADPNGWMLAGSGVLNAAFIGAVSTITLSNPISMTAGQTICIYVQGVGINVVFGAGATPTYSATVSSDANLAIISGFGTGGAPGAGTTLPSPGSYDFAGSLDYSLSSYTYAWSDGQTTQNATGLPLGPISVTVTDCNGCTAADSWFVLTNYIYGCMDPLASNFDVTANTDDGTCLYDGCTDTTANNYDASANNDDGSCTYACMHPNSGSWDDELTVTFSPDWYSDEASWTITNALTGDTALASPAYANGGAVDVHTLCAMDGCYYLNGYDSFGDGWGAGAQAGTLEVVDAAGNVIGFLQLQSPAFSGSSLFTVGSANCTLGCTDAAFANYNANAVIDDGSCANTISGCTDPLAVNYTLYSNVDDGSCCYSNAVSIAVGGGSYLSEVGWTLSLDTVVIASGGAPYAADLCLVDGCYTVDMTDSWGDGWNGSTFVATAGGVVIGSGGLPSGSAGSFTFAVGTGICAVYGCTDTTASNYDPAATNDDGSCCFDEVVAVTTGIIYFGNPYSWSFNSQSWTVNLLGDPTVVLAGSTIAGGTSLGDAANGCLPAGCYEFISTDGSGWIGAYAWFNINGTQYDGLANGGAYGNPAYVAFAVGSATCPVQGCTDPTATNYDPAATYDNGTCTYPCLDNAVAMTMYDSFGDGWNGNTYVITDLTSLFTVATGGLVSGAYGQDALCLPDGCYEVVVGGGLYPGEVSFDFAGLVGSPVGTYLVAVGTGVCPVYGCTDTTATNYNALADADDGSCTYPCLLDEVTLNLYDSFGDGWNLGTLSVNGVTYTILDVNGNATNNVFTTYPGGYATSYTVCLDLSVCTPVIYTAGSYSSENSWSITDASGTVIASGPNASGEVGACPVPGCTDSTAFNYNAAANTDDGSCIAVVNGCTDLTACNYNAAANTDDGSCVYGAALTVTTNVCVSATTVRMTGPWWGWDPNGGPVAADNGNGTWTFTFCPAPTADMEYLLVVDGVQENLVNAPHPDIDGDGYGDLWGCSPITDYWSYANRLWLVGSGNVTNTYATCGSCSDVYGCMDATATNYDATANVMDYLACTYCVYGCTDNTQSNYNAAATCDDGSCIPFTGGCTDPLAANYNPVANTDDGSCLFLGCTNPLATNYDPAANLDNGTCIFALNCSGTDPVTGVFVNEIIDTKATFNWSNMNTSTCAVDQLLFRYRKVGTSGWTNKYLGQPLGSTTYYGTSKTVIGLIPSSTYEYQFKLWYAGVTNPVNWSSNPSGTFTTLDACPNVANLTVTTPLTTKATFTWDASNGVYSFVRLKARPEMANPQATDWFNVGGTGVAYGTFTKSKSGLTPGASYRGQAKTWCNPNGGDYRSNSWTPLVYWTQPTIRLEGGESIANLDVYPNPSRDVFNVTFTSEDVQDLEVRVINLVGEVVYTENLQQFVGEYTKSIDLATYTKGVYFLEITTDNGVVNKKLILQ